MFRRNQPPIDCEEMMERGFDLLRRNNPQEALKLGKRLEEHRYSGAFEIQALALWDLGRRGAAISALERGVKLVPDIWVLWQLLGSYLSYEKRFPESFEAYERALQCDCDETSVQYNYSNALVRAGRSEEAKERLEPLLSEHLLLRDPQLGRLVVGLYEDILRGEGREQDADEVVEKFVAVIARAATAGGHSNILV